MRCMGTMYARASGQSVGGSSSVAVATRQKQRPGVSWAGLFRDGGGGGVRGRAIGSRAAPPFVEKEHCHGPRLLGVQLSSAYRHG
jgi:hypothetical protein